MIASHDVYYGGAYLDTMVHWIRMISHQKIRMINVC